MDNTERVEMPNAARIYDYFLGGTHFYEPDRQAAEFMASLLPSTGSWVRKLRRFLHESAMQLAAEGFEHFLDLGSGFPTKDHIHTSVPRAQVVYVDHDASVVADAQRMIGVNPRVQYVQGDLRDIESILRLPAVAELRERSRKVAIGFNAVSCFIDERQTKTVAEATYRWAPAGSKLFASFETKNERLMTDNLQRFLAMFEQVGSPYYFTTREQAELAMQPWRGDARGFRPIVELLDPKGATAAEEREGVELEFYGAILVK